jgi:ABC-type nitrate/sulfonate/bicarbonate transport system substrate-binding protein
MTRARFMSVVGLMVSLTLVAAACGGDDDGDDTGAAATTGAAAAPGECETIDEMEIGHPGLPPDFIQMVTPLSMELGYMADECIEVTELVDFESGIAAFRAMAAGEFDVGLSGSVSPILAFGEGADAKIFAASGAYLDFQVVGAGDIDSCEAMEGRIVGTDGPGGLVHAVTEQFLAGCGLDINNDVELIIGDPETFVPQIAQGAIEATSMHIDERIFAEKELDTPLNILANAWEDVPEFHYASFATASETLVEKRDLFVRMTAAILRTGRWLNDEANHDEAVSLMAEVGEVPDAVMEEAFTTYGSRFPDSCETMIPMESYQFLIDLQVDLGNLEESFAPTDLVDTSVCADAEALLEEQGF